MTPQILQCKVQNEQLALQNLFSSSLISQFAFCNLQFAMFFLTIDFSQNDVNATNC
jgi:hypothetical protein